MTRATPKSDGFYMPAEFAPHLRTWMMWPCRAGLWDDMAATRKAYRDVAHAIRAFEPLTMVVRPEDMTGARDLLGSDIELMESPIDDSWCRDAGPCFLTDGKGGRAGVSFRFNAWGGKYDPYDGDDAVADAILDAAGVRGYASELIAEGGGVSVDGEGTVLTTRSCFPNANRNPDWSEAEITEELKQMLGADKVIWLPGDAWDTETDGHVDGIAAFVAPGRVLMEGTGNPEHFMYEVNLANLEAMDQQTDAKGREIKITMIPDAETVESDSDKFCRSYVNSYLVNGGVIMPSYGIAEDSLARETFETLFPDRAVSMVDITAIAPGGGGIHCITQQEPAP
ncbi:MAG: agmatine deiminase family protein [Pseudomonadota bacterium]